MASTSLSPSGQHSSVPHSSSASLQSLLSSPSSQPPMSTTDLTPVPASSPPALPSPQPSDSGNAPSLASSASLYLYTFLATLVLLLSVSAAIVVRSFLLRRRHRRMIEEAIRNGTWMPPPPGSGRNAPRIDLSKKPRMWELYLDLNGQLHPQHHLLHPQAMSTSMSMDDRDWEGMKPFMATYVHDPSAKRVSPTNQNGGAGAGVRVGAGTGSGAQGGNNEDTNGHSTTLFRRVARTVGIALSPNPSGPRFGQSTPTTNNSPSEQQDMQMTELSGSSEPAKVRVAVLIAMPRQHPASSLSSSTSNIASPSTSRSVSSGSTPQMSLLPHSTAGATDEDEEELPHIEMGVAELLVTDSTSVDVNNSTTHHLHHHHHHHDAKGKVRESIASIGSV